MKKIALIIFFTLLMPKIALAQYRLQNNEELDGFNTISKEQVFIHFNDNLLLSGEYLYYKFYCRTASNNTPSKISKIGYVALIGKDDNLIFQHKIKLDEGLGQGDFFIPVDIQTGHYKLIGFTQWMRNQGEQSFFSEDIVIVNPFQKISNGANESSGQVLVHNRFDSLVVPSPTQEITPSFQIKLDQRTFGKRQLVKFDLQGVLEHEVSDLSISVRKKDSIKIPFQKRDPMSVTTNTISTKKWKSGDSIYLPELRGELISGRIISKVSKLPIPNKDIGLSIAGENGLTMISRSNENGTFYFNVDKGFRSNQMLFNIPNSNQNEIEVVLDSATLNLNSYDFKEITISQDLNPILEQRSIYNQIENAFFEQKSDQISSTFDTISVYRDLQEVYDLDDYTRFPTLKETIVEIIENVLVKKRKGKFFIQVRGNDEFFINTEDAPLVLVDNVLVPNTGDLFEFDVHQIKRISLSRNDYYIGPKKYQGIFSIDTKDGDYSSFVSTKSTIIKLMVGPLPIKKYYTQDYSLVQLKNAEHNADFRQQLIWLPNVVAGKESSFEFYTSDNIGTYQISIKGFTKSGTPISLREEIYVD